MIVKAKLTRLELYHFIEIIVSILNEKVIDHKEDDFPSNVFQ